MSDDIEARPEREWQRWSTIQRGWIPAYENEARAAAMEGVAIRFRAINPWEMLAEPVPTTPRATITPERENA